MGYFVLYFAGFLAGAACWAVDSWLWWAVLSLMSWVLYLIAATKIDADVRATVARERKESYRDRLL